MFIVQILQLHKNIDHRVYVLNACILDVCVVLLVLKIYSLLFAAANANVFLLLSLPWCLAGNQVVYYFYQVVLFFPAVVLFID